MIKPRELRIGSLFHLLSNGRLRIPLDAILFCVEEIGFDTVSAVTIEENPALVGTWKTFKYSDITPVTITPKILTLCGFEQREDGFFTKELPDARMALGFYQGQYDKMSLFQMQGPSYDEAKEFRMNFGANHPKFLHQLQSLYFSLAGEELMIKQKSPA